jgi:hypothetical protein
MQDKGDPSISDVMLPLGLALKVEEAKRIGYITTELYRYVADRHRSDLLYETRYSPVVSLYACPPTHWEGHFLRNIDEIVVALIPDGLEDFHVHRGKPATILLNHRCNLLPVLVTS